jgi:hypothetical protein
MSRIILILVLVLASGSAAALTGQSAVRAPGISYRAYMAQKAPLASTISRTAAGSAVDWGQPLPTVAAWESEQVLNDRFRQVRNERWMPSPDRANFPRRISWLYPDDGCFARAALMMFNFGRWLVTLPNKIFAFGDLQVRTPNSPGGLVTWWYHVAPVVEVNGQKYVIDPAIQPDRPLRLEEWIGAMSEQPKGIQVAVCASGTYDPYDDCSRVSDGTEQDAFKDEPYYLSNEWRRLSVLKRDPVQELGDNPPWH